MMLRIRVKARIALLVALVFIGANRAQGGVIETSDRDQWFALVGQVTTIDFTGFANGTLVTDQYLDQGVLFTDGLDFISCCSDVTFPNDGSGLNGFGDIHLSFTTPQAWIAVDFPGIVQFELFSAGESIYISSSFGGGGAGFFAGLISSQLFDAAIIRDPLGFVFIDDLHFGVPAPGALALLALAALSPRRRRRPD